MVAQPSMTLSEQILQQVRVELYRDIRLHTFLRDDPQEAKKLYGKLHMEFEPLHLDRSSRIIFLRELFDRCMIDSFGDLTFAEAHVLLQYQDVLERLYVQTLRG